MLEFLGVSKYDGGLGNVFFGMSLVCFRFLVTTQQPSGVLSRFSLFVNAAIVKSCLCRCAQLPHFQDFFVSRDPIKRFV